MSHRSTLRWCLILLTVCLVLPVAEAQVPQAMNYQGHLTDANGNPLATGTYTLLFRIYDQPQTGGTLIWGHQEFTNETVVDGYFNVVLSVDVFSRSIETAFGTPDRYLEVTVDGNTILPRQQVLPAPSAISAGGLVGKVATTGPSATVGNMTTYGANGTTNAFVGGNGSNEGRFTANDSNGAAKFEAYSTNGEGRVVIRGGTGNWVASLEGNGGSEGRIQVYNTAGQARVSMVSSGSVGWVDLLGSNGNRNSFIGNNGANEGRLEICNSAGAPRVKLFSSGSIGFVDTLGSNGNRNSFLGNNGANDGFITVNIPDGSMRAQMRTFNNLGFVAAYGPNGNLNGAMNRLADENIGTVCSYDGAGAQGGCVFGNGLVGGDSFMSITDHPTRSGSKIAYAGLNGPEKAIFVRGKVQLDRGRATINLPEHFAASAAPGTISVSLTPHSLDSKGVGVGSVERDTINVGELFGGTGSYEVSYVVHATRHDGMDFKAEITQTEYEARYMAPIPEDVPIVPSPATQITTQDPITTSTLDERN